MAERRCFPARRASGVPVWLACAVLASLALAQPSPLIHHRGRVVDTEGAPVPDGNYGMEFRFYDSCDGGRLLLTDVHGAVPVRSGHYDVLLGSGNVVPGVVQDMGALFGSGESLCLVVRFGDDCRLEPRQEILPGGTAGVEFPTSRVPESPETASLMASVGAAGGAGGVEEGSGLTDTVELADGTSIAWPHVTGSARPNASFRIVKAHSDPQPGHPNAEGDEFLTVCYNCTENGVSRQDIDQHAYKVTIEANYWDAGTESLEYNWTFFGRQGEYYRPFINRVFVDGPQANRGYFHFWAFNEMATRAPHLELETDGLVKFSRGMFGEIVRNDPGQSYIGGASAIRQDSRLRPDADGGNFTGVRSITRFDSTSPDRRVQTMTGGYFLNRVEGATEGREIGGYLRGLDVRTELSSTGACSGSLGGRCAVGNQAQGIFVDFAAEGDHLSLPIYEGIRIARPRGLGANVRVRNFFGIRVEDQVPDDLSAGFATSKHAAIMVERQSGSSPHLGNIWMRGGNHDNGHIAFGDSGATRHLWVDGGGALRYKDAAPSSETDGKPLTENQKCVTLMDPSSSDDRLWFRAERDMTVTGIDCLLDGGSSAVIRVRECSANGGSCSDTESSLTCGSSNIDESGGIDNPTIDRADWVRLEIDSVSGNPDQLAVCVTYLE